MILILGGMFLAVFSFGNWFSEWLDSIFRMARLVARPCWHLLLAGSGLVGHRKCPRSCPDSFSYILPFYILLYLLEDWGYIARISFLMDKFMHKMGIHGKACVSFIIGLGAMSRMPVVQDHGIEAGKVYYGCAVTLVPCSAVSVIVFGLVREMWDYCWHWFIYLCCCIDIYCQENSFKAYDRRAGGTNYVDA